MGNSPLPKSTQDCQWQNVFLRFLRDIGIDEGNHAGPVSLSDVTQCNATGTNYFHRLQTAWGQCPLELHIVVPCEDQAVNELDLQLDMFRPVLRHVTETCHTDHTLVSIVWESVYPDDNEAAVAHTTLLHIDRSRRVHTFLDPLGAQMPHHPTSLGRIMEQRVLLPEYRSRVVRFGRARGTLQDAWEPAVADEICPRGSCNRLCQLVAVCCHRFRWYDLGAVARTLRDIALSRPKGQPGHDRLRIGLALWQLELFGPVGPSTERMRRLVGHPVATEHATCSQAMVGGADGRVTPCRRPLDPATLACARHGPLVPSSNIHASPLDPLDWPRLAQSHWYCGSPALRALRFLQGAAFGVVPLPFAVPHLPDGEAVGPHPWLAIVVSPDTRMQERLGHPSTWPVNVDKGRIVRWFQTLAGMAVERGYTGLWVDMLPADSEFLREPFDALGESPVVASPLALAVVSEGFVRLVSVHGLDDAALIWLLRGGDSTTLVAPHCEGLFEVKADVTVPDQDSMVRGLRSIVEAMLPGMRNKQLLQVRVVVRCRDHLTDWKPLWAEMSVVWGWLEDGVRDIDRVGRFSIELQFSSIPESSTLKFQEFKNPDKDLSLKCVATNHR